MPFVKPREWGAGRPASAAGPAGLRRLRVLPDRGKPGHRCRSAAEEPAGNPLLAWEGRSRAGSLSSMQESRSRRSHHLARPALSPGFGSCRQDASPQLRAREVTLPPHSPRERERKEGSDTIQQVLGVLARFRKRGRLAGERGESIPWAYFLPRTLST